MDPLLLLTPLLLALVAVRIGLPPLIGYLTAGFALFGAGIDALDFLNPVADLGVLLLLFAIGLKLDLNSLTKREVWGTATTHMLIIVFVCSLLIKALALLGLGLFDQLSNPQILTLGFALSFSSTVFAIKTLEESGDLQSLYGRTAIGILIMQDIFAVVYLTISKGVWPSPWALVLLALPLARPLLFRIMKSSGHGEMLVLFGLVMALVPGAALFDAVGLKPDLGALLMGILLAGHAKSSELSKSLFLFKELFLVAFFLTIGQQGIPSLEEITTALALLTLLPLKLLLFVGLLLLFRLRLRTSFMSALTLGNFSEFGLIVMTAAIATGGLEATWLRVIALMVAFSFLIAAPLGRLSQGIYQWLLPRLSHWQRHPLHPEDQPIHIGQPKILIFGMGRIGSAAYDSLDMAHQGQVMGIDHKQEIIERHKSEGRRAVLGDGTDSDFWDKLVPSSSIDLIVLAMPSHQGNLHTAELLFNSDYKGKVTAIVRYPDEEEALIDMGVHSVYNIYQAAGTGLADQILETLPASLKSNPSL
ncbi:potassium transporter Kef [Ferrimonas sediminicola]|uniref:Potassium transporter Kef n=1 Tax=Ferrimonas sediminicola TaxID=2569538 RepID=A0A4U1B6D8_9GAMM|nr:cation:proton antiporter family protein [Ferrimonas sediminicola]TKB45995.1 potassium transporter Kef [Ferrimonas sediminicola]